jgi:hypothetical protein
MAKDGIRVHIYGDYDDKQINKVQRDLESLKTNAGQTQQKFGAMSKGMKIAGAAIAAAAAAAAYGVVRFAGESISAASDLEESLSKVRTVFGDASGSVETFAKDAAVNLGLSEQAALEATGTFGNLFTAMGINAGKAAGLSTEVVQLAADLASFNNIDVQEAIVALRSGLVGETEPLRRLGVNLSAARIEAYALESGLVATKGQLDAATKAQAAWALITQDAATASGDFARTSDGLANTQRILRAAVDNASASVGKGLVIALQDATQQAGGPEGLANAIESVGEEIGYMVRGGATVIQYLDDLADGFNEVARRAGFADEDTDNLGKQLSRLLSRGPQEGIKVIGNALADLGREQEAAAAATAAMADVMSGSVKPADHLANSLDNLRAKTDAAGDAARAYVEQTGVQLFQIQAANKTYRDAGVRAHRMAEDTREAAEAADKLTRSTGASARSVDKMRINFKQAAKDFGDARVSIEGDAVKVSEALGNAFEARTEVFRNVVRTQVGIIQSATAELDSYADSVTNTILGSLDFATTDAEGNPLTPEQIFQAIMGDIDNREAAVKAIAESNIMTRLPEALAQKILTLPPDAAVALANYFSANPAQLEQLTNNYNALATYTKTALGVPMAETFAKVGDESAVEMIANARERIGKAADNFKKYVKRKLSTTITVGVRYQALNSLPGVSGGTIDVQTRANGGPISAGMPTLVGERGPELIVPAVDSTVVRSEYMPRGGGSTINLTVNAGMGTDGRQVGRQIVEALKQYERSNGPVPIKVA